MGIVVRVMGKRQLIYTANQTTIIARAISAKDHREGTVLVRVFDNQMGTSSSITVTIKACAPSEDAPEIDFTSDTAVATAVIDTGTASATGKLVRGAFAANFGGWVLVQIDAAKGSGNCNATIDIEISLKE